MTGGTDDLAAVLGELDGALGRGGIVADPDDVARYVEPARGPAGAPVPVLRPADVASVREVVRWAKRHRVRLLPQGANSGLVGASTPPPEPDRRLAVVALERLDGEPVVDPVDRTATVDAGTRLSRLEAVANPHGLTLPIDLGADPSIGGMVATNTGGARMLRHGDVRRHLLGVQVVVADDDASVIDERTTLRKHNVGPSISQLVVGSSGALGIVTGAVFELDRLPVSRACGWVIPATPRAALDALIALERRLGPWLEAFEVVSADAFDATTAQLHTTARPFGARPTPELVVLVELAGPDPDAEDRLVVALDALAKADVIEDAVVLDPSQAWSFRHGITEALRRTGTVVGFDVSVPRPALPALRDRLRAAVHRVAPQVVVADFGHWGDGGIHFNLVLPHQAEPPAEPTPTTELLREVVFSTVVEEFGGSFSAEHGIGPHNAERWTRSIPEPVRAATARLKQVFDPDGVLGHPGLPFG